MKQTLFFIFFSFLSYSIQAQEQRLEFNIGIDPPHNAFHAGINLQISQKLDVGFSAGSIPYNKQLTNHVNIGSEKKISSI